MLVCDYIVARLDGDYAWLSLVDDPSADLKCVARALLPDTINEGTKLHYECMEYSISD